MRTAEQTYNYVVQENKEQALKLIKKYAKNVAKQVLRDAAKNAKIAYDDIPFSDAIGVDEGSILMTEITTP